MDTATTSTGTQVPPILVRPYPVRVVLPVCAFMMPASGTVPPPNGLKRNGSAGRKAYRSQATSDHLHAHELNTGVFGPCVGAESPKFLLQASHSAQTLTDRG